MKTPWKPDPGPARRGRGWRSLRLAGHFVLVLAAFAILPLAQAELNESEQADEPPPPTPSHTEAPPPPSRVAIISAPEESDSLPPETSSPPQAEPEPMATEPLREGLVLSQEAPVSASAGFGLLEWFVVGLSCLGIGACLVVLLLQRRAIQQVQESLATAARHAAEMAPRQQASEDALRSTLAALESRLIETQQTLANVEAGSPEPVKATPIPMLEPLPELPLLGPIWPLPVREILARPEFARREEPQQLWEAARAYHAIAEANPAKKELSDWLPVVHALGMSLYRYLSWLGDVSPEMTREAADHCANAWRQGVGRDIDRVGVSLVIKRTYVGARFDSDWMHAVSGSSGSAVAEPLSWALAEKVEEAAPRLLERARVRLG